MYLTIDIDTPKSTLFLDLLNLLKQDRMINDFQVIIDTPNLSSYEKELLQDFGEISTAIDHANRGKGRKKDMTLNF